MKVSITYAEKVEDKVCVSPTVHFTIRVVRINRRKGYDVENVGRSTAYRKPPTKITPLD